MNSANTKPEVQPGSDASSAPTAPKLVEVELLRKYCPYHVVNSSGEVTPNVSEVKATVLPGIVKLHPEDATHVLRASGVAVPTNNTFKDL